MATLFSINLNPEIKKSDKLFFDQYRYCIKVQLSEASALRSFDHEIINLTLDLRKNNLLKFPPRSYTKRQRNITEKVRNDLHITCDFFLDKLDYLKIVFHSTTFFYIYTNDLTIIDQIARQQLPMNVLKLTEREINRPKNTIRLRNSNKKARVFFRCVTVTQDQKSHLLRFFENNQEQLRLSPSFEEFLHNSSYRYLQSNFFFDVSDIRLIEMINIIVPEIIRNYQPIISDK